MGDETIRSQIHPNLMRRAVLRGSLFGVLGVGILFTCGTIIKSYGFLAFMMAFCLIGIGLIPYRRLSRLELLPHEIHINCDNLLFSQRGKPLFQIPISCIASVQFIAVQDVYGISLSLTKNYEKKIKLLAPRSHFVRFFKKYINRFPESDCFLPYFSERSFIRLKSLL